MDKELLLIDLLAEKATIHSFFKGYFKKRLGVLLVSALSTSLFFFGFSQIVFNTLSQQTANPFYLQRLDSLLNVSHFLGYVFLVCFALLMVLSILQFFKIFSHFQEWLTHVISQMEHLEILEEDSRCFYFINQLDDKEQPTKKAILKRSIKKIEAIENDQMIWIGHSPTTLGIYQVYLLQEPQRELGQISHDRKTIKNKLLYSLIGITLLSVLLSYSFLRSPFNRTDLTAFPEVTVDSDDDLMIKEGEILTGDSNAPINKQSDVQMAYFYDATKDRYFQTTNYGDSWQEVPISAAATHRGDYTLTTGSIPVDYFMDHTYDISPEFSWYLYSPKEAVDGKLDLNFLVSKDNGVTWENHEIGQFSERLRFRSLQQLKNGQLMLTTSTSDIMSEEYINLYYSHDEGSTWIQGASTTIEHPLQNVTFISQTTGFLATREKLFYTSNGGTSFDEAQLNIPDEYSKEGLDIFTSPYEVTQKSANVLSIRLNLVKTKDVDINKLFECEFVSNDQGATWQFEKQIRRITT